MKTILKKLHIVTDDDPRSPPSISSPEDRNSASEVTNWLDSASVRHVSVETTPSPASSSGVRGVEERVEGPGIDEEEYQLQLALEMSVKEDPEAVQIETVKQISLGCSNSENTAAEVLAFRYWNYNFLTYDDKILDGFYDLYGVILDSSPLKMPSLVDLQGTPMSNNISCEAVMVNKKEDLYLLRLGQKVLQMASETREQSPDSTGSLLVQKVAVLVANHMGGKITYPESMLEEYQNLTKSLRETVGNIVLPLGRITVGLARHRALLFKVLADSMDVPCLLLKGKQYTGSDDGAINIVKLTDGREYIVDLMSEPGTLIPSYGAGLATELEEPGLLTNPFSKDVKSTHMISSSNLLSGSDSYPESEPSRKSSTPLYLENPDYSGATASTLNNQSSDRLSSSPNLPSEHNFSVGVGGNRNSKFKRDDVKNKVLESSRPSHPQLLARSPSWTEGISSPAVRRMKVKDVSEYMINAAKENPQLAQKLHDVLLESGVVAPPNLFTEIYTEEPETSISEDKILNTEGEKKYVKDEMKQKTETEDSHRPFLPFLPVHKAQKKVVPSKSSLDTSNPVEGLRFPRHPDCPESTSSPYSSEASDSQLSDSPLQLTRNMPVAAAAATAAVVASSMVVAAAKTSNDLNLEVPAAATAAAAAVTATAAAVVATTAAVSKQYEQLESSGMPLASGHDGASSAEKTEVLIAMQQNSNVGPDDLVQTSNVAQQESDLISDRSTGAGSVKSESSFDDVAEFEIPWEDIVLGQRIGLGSFGEVYRGDWHGTEVAVKRFLHQSISSEALEEFISEVRIMKRMRHPNVVLFMGAVTHVPNLSIVTEFLHRGSLFRLIHRPNNQLDERRRLRMALDVARGMNYLHNCTPMIVHRDLKSPNLLVDRNWVVKVCDFGLSRLKHSTFLSSRSTAGTAEWMAPEVLRNEPSNEKCDVFSFGVVLWELCTMQQPWEGMNPMQVVGAVGFQHRTLDIPDDMDPVIANIISKCWQADPRMRPSFLEIMAALKPLQKPASNSQGIKQRIL